MHYKLDLRSRMSKKDVKKRMLPWREQIRDIKMLEAMFKLAAVTGKHKKNDENGQRIKKDRR